MQSDMLEKQTSGIRGNKGCLDKVKKQSLKSDERVIRKQAIETEMRGQ